VYVWKNDKARRINRLASGSGPDVMTAWCFDIADGFDEWAGERDACGEDPLPFASYCADLLACDVVTGWVAEQVAWYFGPLSTRCHAVIVAEVRHAVSQMAGAK
jgi:hypothetical protein